MLKNWEEDHMGDGGTHERRVCRYQWQESLNKKRARRNQETAERREKEGGGTGKLGHE